MNQAAVVENKRLGPILAYIAERQKELDVGRAKGRPGAAARLTVTCSKRAELVACCWLEAGLPRPSNPGQLSRDSPSLETKAMPEAGVISILRNECHLWIAPTEAGRGEAVAADYLGNIQLTALPALWRENSARRNPARRRNTAAALRG